MHWRSGSRPWALCSCPWKRCRPSRKLLAKWFSICIILSVSLNWTLQLWFDHTVLFPIYLKEIHSRPRQFLTRLKYLLSQVNDPVLLLLCPTFEFYPVVSRECLAIAPHLTNFVEVIPFLVVITLRVLGCCQPRTPIRESNPHYNSIPLVICC